ncbi:probable C-mannosyltransferase DPY19L4 [Lates japonicus]|uniref:Probable C-mannosyltransferase DPY19L4 n=1 Tax=Lates japonicus TaxID=270547 RepID=A0AAD3R907_LATJO|nr:probable C-mannosyltransferase DPY19L4 [Lates japonicus]
MTELKCRKTETLEGGEEGEECQNAPELQNERVNEPVSAGDEGSVSSGGAGENSQQRDEGEVKEDDGHQKQEESNRPDTSVKRAKSPSTSGFLQRLVRVFFGCLAAVACGMLYAVYLSTYHDRKFWFSTRQELEREITFQAGSGLYYYYYKHMLAAPSFERGFYELMTDNRTLSGQTINAVERLSLYPELITSFIYRVTGSQDFVEPIYFYIGAVFGLQAVYVTALFVCSWVMSGTWVAGMLAVAWYVINRPDTTKVDHAIPLRDNWALPYFSCQVAALTGFLSNNISSATEIQEFDQLDRSQVPVAAVFAGSPQLLGTVKLFSGSAVTSLPLYSDINLLRRSEDTYQVCAMRSAEELYKILMSQKTNYVIIEESMCNELSLTKGCRIKDLLDISNGHVVYDKGDIYSFSKHGRFCQEIKMNYSPYTNYFTRVFWNRSYHVYKVNSVISFQY